MDMIATIVVLSWGLAFVVARQRVRARVIPADHPLLAVGGHDD